MADEFNQPVAAPVQVPVQAPVAEPQPVAQPQMTPQPGYQGVDPYVPQPLPPTAPDRTREQFEKLIENNRELARANAIMQQEMARRAQTNQQFAPIQQVQSVPNQQVDPKEFIEVDPYTGQEFLNEQKLKAKIDEVNTRATRAEQQIQNYIQTAEQREIDRQNRETFASYPELDPNNPNHDKGFHQRTRQVLIDALMNPQDYGGRPLSFKEAADLVKQERPSQLTSGMDNQNQDTEQAQQRAQQAAESQEVKAAASAAIANQPPTARVALDDEDLHRELSRATRLGDDEALAARLRMSDHTRRSSGDED